MKQLRAEGIKKLLGAQRRDAMHLLRLSRDDAEIQRHLTSAIDSLELAHLRATETIEEVEEERTSA